MILKNLIKKIHKSQNIIIKNSEHFIYNISLNLLSDEKYKQLLDKGVACIYSVIDNEKIDYICIELMD